MGRKNKKYAKTLHQQTHEKLLSMQAFGYSRAHDKQTGADRYRIYSYRTYTTYRRAAMRFVSYVQKNHPECTTLKRARRYVNEYLQFRVDTNMSSWTVAMETCALSKLYGIPPDDPDRFHAPPRHRMDIKRSRVDTIRDRHFSVTNNKELIDFVCATGTRRNVLQRLRGDDLWSRDRIITTITELRKKDKQTEDEHHFLNLLEDTLSVFPEQDYFLWHYRDKGGKNRMAPILGNNKRMVIERMKNTAPNELVWQNVHSAADIHGYRAKYAQLVYKQYARNISDIPFDKRNKGSGRMYQSEVYCCKKDERGRKLDRKALYIASRALGHNRIDVIPNSYLYGL